MESSVAGLDCTQLQRESFVFGLTANARENAGRNIGIRLYECLIKMKNIESYFIHFPRFYKKKKTSTQIRDLRHVPHLHPQALENSNIFFLFLFLYGLPVPHSRSSTQSWGSVPPSIVETRDQNSQGSPLLFLNRKLGYFCA